MAESTVNGRTKTEVRNVLASDRERAGIALAVVAAQFTTVATLAAAMAPD